MLFHLSAPSLSAPAIWAVICFLIFKVSPGHLATKHQLDVCALVHRYFDRPDFGVDPCFMPYLPAFPKAFASSNLSHPSLHRHALQFACLELLQAKDRVTTFHKSMDDFGMSSAPGVPRFHTGSQETCNLPPCRKHWQAALDLLILIGPSRFDDACRHSLNFTISSDPQLLTGEDFRRGSPVTI